MDEIQQENNVTDLFSDLSPTEDTKEEISEVSTNETIPEISEKVQPEKSEDETIEDNGEDKSEDNSDNQEISDEDLLQEAGKIESDSSLHKLTIDGMEKSVTIDELKSGYLRQADYTRKTQETASINKILREKETEISEMKEKLSEKLSNDISIYKRASKPFFDEIAKDGFLDDDQIAKYQREWGYQYQDAQKDLASEVTAKMQEQAQKIEASTQEAISNFIEKNPDYQDDNKQIELNNFMMPSLQSNEVGLNKVTLELFKDAFEGKRLKSRMDQAQKNLKNKKVKKAIAPYQKTSQEDMLSNGGDEAELKKKGFAGDKKALNDYLWPD